MSTSPVSCCWMTAGNSPSALKRARSSAAATSASVLSDTPPGATVLRTATSSALSFFALTPPPPPPPPGCVPPPRIGQLTVEKPGGRDPRVAPRRDDRGKVGKRPRTPRGNNRDSCQLVHERGELKVIPGLRAVGINSANQQ